MLAVLHACLHARWARVHECVQGSLCAQKEERKALEGAILWVSMAEEMPAPVVRMEEVKE